MKVRDAIKLVESDGWNEEPSHVRAGFNSRETVLCRADGGRSPALRPPTRTCGARRSSPASRALSRPSLNRGLLALKPPLHRRSRKQCLFPLPSPPSDSRWLQAGDQQPISRADILRGYEVEPDQDVTLDRDEWRSLQRRTSTNMEIVRSVRLSEIDPVFLETSYYVGPGSRRR